MMKDFFGQPIDVGDTVYCSKYNSKGDIRTIKKFDKTGVQALCTRAITYHHYIPTGQGYTEKGTKRYSKWFDLTQLIRALDGYNEQGN